MPNDTFVITEHANLSCFSGTTELKQTLRVLYQYKSLHFVYLPRLLDARTASH